MIKKQKAIIVDIDGTLANVNHRRSRLEESNDWKEFNSRMSLDSLNEWCREIIENFKHEHKIILVTGREQKFSKVTKEWLSVHKICFDLIYFRPNEDFRADEVVKKEIYHEYILDRYEILFVVDDRKRVVQMWRSLGLVCLQCDEGDF